MRLLASARPTGLHISRVQRFSDVHIRIVGPVCKCTITIKDSIRLETHPHDNDACL